MPNGNRKSRKIAARPGASAAKAVIKTTAPGRGAMIAVLLFTAFLYLRAAGNGLTIFDDDFYVINNPFIRDFSWHGIYAIFSSFYASNYHPVTTLTYLLEFKAFGLDPLPYHLTNIALHVLNTWLVYKLIKDLSGRESTALIVSLLFGIHPMHVESVAWVSERKDVLYSAFYLLSLRYYLKYLSGNMNLRLYLLTLVLFLLSLCSKAAAVTLPVLLFAFDYYKGRKITRQSISEKIPFLALAVLFGILNIKAQGAGGSINDLTDYGIINRVFLFFSCIGFYLLKVVAPYPLSAMHYLPLISGHLLPWVYYVSLPVVLGIVWIISLMRTFRREVLFGCLFFLITISVMLQIITVGSILTAERYTYIPYIGLFYIAGQWITGQIEAQKHSAAIRWTGALLILMFSAITWDRISIWKDDTTLIGDLINKNPDMYYGYWLRGNLEKKSGDVNAAFDDYSRAIRMKPNFDDAYYNRGVIYALNGNHKAAIADYDKAISINPRSASSYNNRGWEYYLQGEKDKALPDFSKAISMKADYAEAYNNRGWVYVESADTAHAIPDFIKAMQLAPDYDKPYFNLAAVYLRAGNYLAAIGLYNELTRRFPELHNAYYYRGVAKHEISDNAGACLDWKKAQDLGNDKAGKMLGQYCH